MPAPRPVTQLSSYSDASSSYWPPGWNIHRFLHATVDDNEALPDDERAKMQAGFRNVLGEDGVHELARLVWQEQQRLEQEASSSPRPTLPTPDWLKAWKRHYRGQPWGFVAFRTGGTNLDYKEFRSRIKRIVELPFDAAVERGHSADEIAEARSTFGIRWVDVGDDRSRDRAEGDLDHPNVTDPVERLRAEYRALRESDGFPPGLQLPLFLCASADAIASVLRIPPSSQPGTDSPRWRPGAPFLLVVTAEDEQGPVDDEASESGVGREKDWFKPVFKAAAEVLVEELWGVAERQITSMRNLTRFVRGTTILDSPSLEDEDNDILQRDEEAGGSDDGLDDIWWSAHAPPHRMRQRRRIFVSDP
ncbi:unnamed protein product [Clonostachys rhizophaga]|uniref:Uncharacterized protein n=1 Tax=Clonostachys rhizophaga TaxID=160324 RepID=A0A9N9VSA7_9HYPO|nr:unnamed protein product [Clonostachys rhizophaga]